MFFLSIRHILNCRYSSKMMVGSPLNGQLFQNFYMNLFSTTDLAITTFLCRPQPASPLLFSACLRLKVSQCIKKALPVNNNAKKKKKKKKKKIWKQREVKKSIPNSGSVQTSFKCIDLELLFSSNVGNQPKYLLNFSI